MHISSSVRSAAVLLLVLSGSALAQTHHAAPPATAAKPAPAPAAEPAPAPAPLPAPGLNVLVVDVQSLLENSKAAKMVHSQIEQKRIEYTKEISQEEEALRAERDSLQRQQASMSPAVLNKKGREFQQKVNDLDRSVQSKRQALEKSNNDALATIQQTMLRIIADIARQRKANLVLQRTDLVLFDRAFDVTDEVMQKLDEELPVLNVNFVTPTPVGPAPAASAKAKRR
ncbi:MAG TPA: OmpH family outer membrane protein [Stellaceae bacterium]|nr:OmpH family outer membrane protein [Stellaceae bacterium]